MNPNPTKNTKQCYHCNSNLNNNNSSMDFIQIIGCPHYICYDCIYSHLISKCIISHIDARNTQFSFQCLKCHKGLYNIPYELMDKILTKKPQAHPHPHPQPQSQPRLNSKAKVKTQSQKQPSIATPIESTIIKDCQTHKISKAYYCHSCKEDICKECINDKHMFHQWITIDEIKEKLKQKLNDWTYKTYQQLEDVLNKNEENALKELKDNYDLFQGKITMFINELNQYLANVIKERDMKIKEMKYLSNIIRKVYMKYYKDINEIDSKDINEVKYILKAKYEYKAIIFVPFKLLPSSTQKYNESNILYNIKGKAIQAKQQLQLQFDDKYSILPQIQPPSIHYSFIKHSKSSIIYSSKIRKVKECLNMIKTKNTVGSMIYLNENEIYYSSGNIHQDTPDKTIQIYNMKQRKWDTIDTQHKNSVTYLCQINDTQIASGSYDTEIKIYNITTNTVEGELKGHTDAVTMLKLWLLKYLISSSVDSSIKLWDLNTCQCLLSINNKHNEQMLCICIVGNVLYSAGTGNYIDVWSLNESFDKDNPAITSIGVLRGHSDRILILCKNSNDNNIIASGSNDHRIRLWKAHKRKCMGVLHGHNNYISALVFLVDNRLASGSGDKIIRIWNLNKLQCDLTLQGQDGPVFSLLITKDGKLMAGYQQNIIRLWG